MTLSKEEVRKYLPHGDPFVFVDTVDSLSECKSIEASLWLDPSRGFFRGHFPENPIMPGVLIQEALAQTCGLLVSLSKSADGTMAKSDVGQVFYLASANMKFVAIARAGDTLKLSAKLERVFSGLHQFSVSAKTRRAEIARGTVVLATPK